MTQPVSPPNPYGTDFWLGGVPLDLDPSMRLTSGRALLAQNIVCRLSTPRGSVIDCPNDCLDLRGELSDGMTQSAINALFGTIRSEVLKDNRVKDCVATGSYDNETSTFSPTLAVTSLYGPFSLTLEIDSVTVKILNANTPS